MERRGAGFKVIDGERVKREAAQRELTLAREAAE